ncbi:MAG: flagellar hook-basal body complex protein FliE [Candidatus Gastranaerophilales bacterium]|nr:flagellar hook-basal body complex protein FliE [Candidatus Gastranaerophilales bacterium]
MDIGADNSITFGSMSDFGISSQDFNDFSKIDTLDDFASGLDDSEDSTMLKGAISKIQAGQSISADELSGLSGENSQFITDLQELVAHNDKVQRITRLDGLSSTKNVADKFSELLNNYVNNVNQQNKTAENAVETFASGGDIDLHSVMIATEKAELSMQLALQLSNKLLNAYREINNVRV